MDDSLVPAHPTAEVHHKDSLLQVTRGEDDRRNRKPVRDEQTQAVSDWNPTTCERRARWRTVAAWLERERDELTSPDP